MPPHGGKNLNKQETPVHVPQPPSPTNLELYQEVPQMLPSPIAVSPISVPWYIQASTKSAVTKATSLHLGCQHTRGCLFLPQKMIKAINEIISALPISMSLSIFSVSLEGNMVPFL